MAQVFCPVAAVTLLVAASLSPIESPALPRWAGGQDGRNAQTVGADRDERNRHQERYLFVCAGDQSRAAPDFLSVIDFDAASPNYGHVIATEPFPPASASGNEPHHIGLSRDGRTVACGGLLSVLKGQDEVFFFDVSTPSSPRFITSAKPPLSSITDEFYALPHGGFLVTMMGGPSGHAPGRLVEFDEHLQLVAEHPNDPPDDGFNPHGLSVRPELNLLVTSDFICPSTTLDVMPGPLDLRGSVRVWALQPRRIVRTIEIPGAGGTIDVHLIPHDRRARAFTAGMLDDKLYLVDTRAGSASPVFDFATIAKGGWPQLFRMNADGTRLFITMNVAGRVAMFDTSDPEHPRLLSTLDLGPASGPHYLALTRDERRLVVSDYFLNEDDFGKVHQEGDHKVHVAQVTGDSLVLDPRFELDFNTAFPSGPARPHGLAFK
jgi:selenium-binding protein 1